MNKPASSKDIPSLLRNVSESAKAHLRGMSSVFELGKKESLPPQENPPKHVIFIESGWLSVCIHDTTVSVLKQGDTFMGPLLPYGATSASSITLTAVTAATAILVERAPLLGFLNERPDLLFCLYEQSSEQITRLLIRLAHQNEDGLEMRLASFLWGLGLPCENGERSVPVINQGVLAACMGTSREEISRKRQLLVQSGRLTQLGSSWVLSAEVGRMLAARGFGE